MAVLREDVRVAGHFSSDTMDIPSSAVKNVNVSPTAAIARSKLAQDDLASYHLPLSQWRVWNDMSSGLPGTAAADDLGIVLGAFGSVGTLIQTSDAKATTVTQYARAEFIIPHEYVDNETVEIRVNAGMETTVSDGTATVDFEVHRLDGEGGVGGDLVTTNSQSINSLTYSDLDFVINSGALSRGDLFDIRMTIAITDSATGTAVIGSTGEIKIRLDIKG